jgi:hypothetical protein
MLNAWQQFALVSTTITAMLITAKLFSKSEAKTEGQSKTQTDSGLKSPRVTNLAVAERTGGQ